MEGSRVKNPGWGDPPIETRDGNPMGDVPDRSGDHGVERKERDGSPRSSCLSFSFSIRVRLSWNDNLRCDPSGADGLRRTNRKEDGGSFVPTSFQKGVVPPGLERDGTASDPKPNDSRHDRTSESTRSISLRARGFPFPSRARRGGIGARGKFLMGRGKRISRGRSRGPAEDESARKRDRFRLRSETQRLELYHYPRGDAGFRKKLSEIGLRVVKIDSDGNCFFRAVADQLQGVDGDQAMIRAQVVRFMLENREAFEPFVEDDQGFDLYCEDMEEDGTWAGNMELQAASLLLKVNICIHQAGRPAWSVHNFKDPDARTIHLSYHDGDHYNSLRMSHDRGPGPAVPFRFVDANTAVVQEEGLRSRGNAEPSSSDQASPPKAHEDGTLRRGEMGASSNDKGSRRRRPPGAEESPTITEATGAEGRVDPPRITNIQRQPQRNKRCPCGSGLKYGKCCRPGRTASKAAAQDLPAGDEAQKVVCI